MFRMKKKWITGVLFGALLIMTAAAVPADASQTYYRSYSDVRAHTSLETAAQWANLSGVMKGKSEAQFAPKAALKSKVLKNALMTLDPGYVPGAIKQRSSGVTRETFAQQLYRFAKAHGVSVSKKKNLSSYADYRKIAKNARTAYRWAYRAGLLPKAKGKRLQPKAVMTREEAVLALYSFHKLLPEYRGDLKRSGDFREIVISEIAEVEPYGGYSTKGTTALFKQTAWKGLHKAFRMRGGKPVIDLGKARPSFCSGAVYLLLTRSVLTWDTYVNGGGKISSDAWIAMKPYTMKGLDYPPQDDGVGLWGCANANGPGLAVALKKIGAAVNTVIDLRSAYASDEEYWSVWDSAEPGDFLKIFRTEAIGRSEKGHMVVYLGSQYAVRGGRRDDLIWYWSSNGSGESTAKGYYITSCYASEITRGVITKVADPAAFANAYTVEPTDEDKWLASLLRDKDATVAEMKKHI